MNDEIKEILEIFKQVDLEPESGGCYNCPKKDKDKTCIGCLNNAKDKLLDYIHNLYRNNWGNEVKATNQKIKIKELEKRIVKLKDNITNLQQENERLSSNLGELQNAIDNIAELVGIPEGMSVEDVYDKVKDYKSRIEKAVEYIEHSKFIKEQVIMKSNYDMQDFQIRELLNILNGDNNE